MDATITPPHCTEEGLPAPTPMTEEHLATVSRGLGHPARVRIVAMFDKGRCLMAQDVVDECDLAQSTVSEHLRILRGAEILFARKDGPRTWYCLRRSVLRQYADAVARLAADPVSFRAG